MEVFCVFDRREGMDNVLRDSNFVSNVSSAVLEGVTKGQCDTRNRQGRTNPSDDTAMMHMLESVDARLRYLEPMHAQLRSLESMANDTHTLDALTAKVNSLMTSKTQIASVQHRLDDIASEVNVLKCRMSGGSHQPVKVGNIARDMDDASEGATFSPFASRHSLRHPNPIVRREFVDRGAFSPYADEHPTEDIGSGVLEPQAVDGARTSFKNAIPMSARQLRRPSYRGDGRPWTAYDREYNRMGLAKDDDLSPPKRY